MYGSIRIFVDKTPEWIGAQNILGVFELFADALGKTYDFISYTLFDPDKDCALIDEKFLYDPAGKKRFLDTSIIPVAFGEKGDLSAPFLSATCEGKANQIYAEISVQVQFPVYSAPFTIRVDYEQKGIGALSLEKYARLIQGLCALGFPVNNAFYHVYSRKNEAATLDGGQIGPLISLREHENLRNSVMHRKESCLNRIMGIYCANSIRLDSLSEEVQKEITAIVGSGNVMIADDIFSFALGNMETLTPTHRIRCWVVRKKLQKLLCGNSPTS